MGTTASYLQPCDEDAQNSPTKLKPSSPDDTSSGKWFQLCSILCILDVFSANHSRTVAVILIKLRQQKLIQRASPAQVGKYQMTEKINRYMWYVRKHSDFQRMHLFK